MQILAHRGWWHTVDEKNTLVALNRAIDNGYGIETDIRDYDGKLVISHDIATANSPLLSDFLAHYQKVNSRAYLALNIKADGLQKMLLSELEKYHVENYFVFDSSVPELYVYRKMGINYFTRHSEFETKPSMYDEASGVWLDSFNNSWLTYDRVKKHISNNKLVGIISPELHGYDPMNLWKKIKKNKNDNILLCTDLVDKAGEYFEKEN